MSSRSQRIHDLPKDQRPREKLANHGVTSLSDAELIAIFLGTGVQGESAIEIGARLLRQHGSLANLAQLDFAQLTREHGLGPAKASQLAAAFEIGSRVALQEAHRTALNSPQLVYKLMSPLMQRLRQESLQTILVDSKIRLMKVTEISRGTVNETLCHPREVLQPAIAHHASGIIITHNHPSGDPTPSQADRRMTKMICSACELMQIKLHDHVIIGSPSTSHDSYYSFRENGLL